MLGVINKKVVWDLDPDNWRSKGNLYEVVRVIKGKPIFLKEHLLRLGKSYKKLDYKQLETMVGMLINHAEKEINQNIFISLNPNTSESAIFFIDSFYPPEEWYEQGIDINILEIARDNPNIKVYDFNYKKKVSNHLEKTMVFETLISDGGFIKEGSRSNVFFIGNEGLYTPPVEEVLPGITREKVFEIAKEMTIKIIETPIPSESIGDFIGAFVTGTSIDLLPIRSIGELKYATVKDDKYITLLKAYKKKMEKDMAENASQ